MAILVRPLDLGLESQEMIAVLQSNLPHLPHSRLFPWLYLHNPYGQASAWAVVDADSGQMLGAAAAFPRSMLAGAALKRGYLLGDFCINLRYRSLGAAVALQRVCLESLASAGADLVFDFPSQAMLAVYKRLGISGTDTMIRYAKPLRADRKVSQWVPIPVVARVLSAAANTGLRWCDRTPSAREYTITAEQGPWGEEFTEATRTWSANGICVARTSEYLNWRFREHPLQEYFMLTARRAGELCGYLIHHGGDGTWTVDDLQGKDPQVRKSLLAEGTAVARKMRVDTLSVPWLSADPVGQDELRECGFRPRESSPVVTMMVSGTATVASGEWRLTNGDWES